MPANKTPNRRKWTIIIYMAAENDLGEDMKSVYDQIAHVGSNPGEVEFIVLFDGLKIKKNKKGIKGNDGDVTIYQVTRYNYFSDVTENGRFWHRFSPKFDRLTNPENLKFVLRRIKKDFPAENYGFIFKGHGGPNPDITNATITTRPTAKKIKTDGTLESESEVERRMRNLLKGKGWNFQYIFALQETTQRNGNPVLASARADKIYLALYEKDTSSGAVLSYSRLSNVLRSVFCNNGKKLAFVGLDCCWGQTFENGLTFKNVTDYFVASADEMPVLGIGYEGFCNFLLKQPQILPDELANSIVAEYFKTEFSDYLSLPEWKFMGVSLTCVETTYLDDIDRLFSRLSKYLTNNLVTHFYIIHLARLQCKAYTYEEEEDDYMIYCIDLIWFLENLQHYNRVNGRVIDQKLDSLISEVLRAISLYFIKSYMASNYVVKKPGEFTKATIQKGKPFIEPIIGGKGIGIIFPSRLSQYNLSIYNSSSKFVIPPNKEWKKFLFEYVTHKDAIYRGRKKTKDLEIFTLGTSLVFQSYLDHYTRLASDTLRKSLNNARGSIKGRKYGIQHKWIKRFIPKSKPRKKTSAK